MRKNNLPEILSPIGSKESLIAAVNSGCNAVYLGGKDFSARSSADNFTNEELIEAINYCHLRQVKVYIAVNTLFKNSEIQQLFSFIKEMYEEGADAFIVQDIGTGIYIKKYFPNVRLHASTQMTVHDLEGVFFMERMGFDRVVLSRELSLQEIRNIKQNCNIEIEVFVHGALCVSYSGQCLMSSHLGGRSGNRGKCAQPCRLKYDFYSKNNLISSGYLLSPKDLMGLELLPDFMDIGVSSLKIEGRMKSPEYVSAVTKAYSEGLEKALQQNYKADENSIKQITQVFNRGGSFTSGYLQNKLDINMLSNITPKSTGVYIGKVLYYEPKNKKCIISTECELNAGDGIVIWTKTEPHTGTYINSNSPKNSEIQIRVEGNISKGDLVFKSYDKKMMDCLKNSYSKDTRKTQIKCSFKAVQGEPFYVKLKFENLVSEFYGDIVEQAKNQPLSEQKILEQLCKTGDTPFILEIENYIADNNVYIPISKINGYRREAIDSFSEKLISMFKRKSDNFNIEIKKNGNNLYDKKICVLVDNVKQLQAALLDNVHTIYIEAKDEFLQEIDLYTAKAHEKGIKLYAALPHICINWDYMGNILNRLESSTIDGYLIRNYGQLNFLQNSNKEKVTDYTFNVFNALSLEQLQSISERVTLSTELNFNQINDFANEKSEIIVHGRQILMVTRQCPIGLYVSGRSGAAYCASKNKKGSYYLKDRKNIDFPIVTDCTQCTAFIYNSQILFTLNKIWDVINCYAGFIRLCFLEEDEKEVKEVIQCYNELISLKPESKLVKDKIDMYTEMGITNGHFFRGVL